MTIEQIVWLLLLCGAVNALVLGWALRHAPTCRCGKYSCGGGCLKK